MIKYLLTVLECIFYIICSQLLFDDVISYPFILGVLLYNLLIIRNMLLNLLTKESRE